VVLARVFRDAVVSTLAENGYVTKGTHAVLLEIELLSDTIVLSDFDLWHYPLGDIKMYKPQCAGCRHFDLTSHPPYRCAAFDAIPEEILFNDHDHTKPYPGDRGIRFELLDELKQYLPPDADPTINPYVRKSV
jgi:hypothetical protein